MFATSPKSSLCLAASCIAAIAAVGSIFEISSGTPQLGSTTTWAILLFSLPLTIILLYAAIRIAQSSMDN